MKNIRIFIGYDHRQTVAYSVLNYSLLKHTTCPVSVTPLVLPTLPLTRDSGTPFTYSRFLVPWLCDFQGWALFLDIDMLVTADVNELFGYANDAFAVMVVNTEQTFERASMMLFNCAHADNKRLTPEYIDSPQTNNLHNLGWINNNKHIGFLPSEWNFIVGTDSKKNQLPKLIHYTQGIPAHAETEGCDYAEVWQQTHEEINTTRDWQTLLGKSVFATRLASGRVVPRVSTLFQEEQKRVMSAIKPIATSKYSRNDPGPRFRMLSDMYKDMHENGTASQSGAETRARETFDGRSLLPHVDNIKMLTSRFNPQSLLDYSCGKGACYRTENLRLSTGETVDSLQAYWGLKEIKLFDAGYAPYSEIPTGQYDAVICTDVLEHCDEHDLGWILREIFTFAKHFVYLNIACYPAQKLLPNGENAHITVQSSVWWDMLLKHTGSQFPDVRYFALAMEAQSVNGQMQPKPVRLSG